MSGAGFVPVSGGRPGAPIAILRDPTDEEASRWHKPRTKTAKVRMKLLVEFLGEDPTVKVVKRTDSGAELVVDTGNGTTLRLTLNDGAIEVRPGPCVLRSDQTPIPRAAYIDMIGELIEMLQVGSGFYVYSDELVGFDPRGACPKCGVEVFEWQDE